LEKYTLLTGFHAGAMFLMLHVSSLDGEERAVPDPRIPRIINALNQLRRILPPLKKLLFEAFWFVFATVEIVRFLRSLF
jgi:hypothetical protein